MRQGTAGACAVLVILMMFSVPFLAFTPTVSSDPVETENPDDTATLVWDFDDPADYTLSGAAVSGGSGTLERENRSESDDDSADFALGEGSNVDASSVPGSVMILDTDGGEYRAIIQPNTVSDRDAYISEDRPNDNYGDEVTLRLDSESGKEFRILFRFDLSVIPSDACIKDAFVYLYQLPGSRAQVVDYTVHALNVSYDPLAVTWNRNDSATTWDTPGGDFGTSAYSSGSMDDSVGWHGTEVSKLVEGWVKGTVPNTGMILVPQGTGGDAVKIFQSAEETALPEQAPKLVVNYTREGNFGVFDSRVMGPGTSTEFTYASWENGTESLASDEFSGSTLSSRWTWMNDPSASGGDYDVGQTTPGWLHVLGSKNSQNIDTSIGSNYLYEPLTGDFEVILKVKDYFTANSMGAGILVLESPGEWVSVEKADQGDDARIRVVACAEGTSSQVATLSWANLNLTYLKATRNEGSIELRASDDGISWTLIYTHTRPLGFAWLLDVGLFIYSQSVTNPQADFDFFRAGTDTAVETGVMVRTGDSTDTSDPSWTGWSAWLPGDEAALGMTAKYLQYRVYLETDRIWYTPRFDMFTCWFERYSPSGVIETENYTPSDFSMWLTMTTEEDPSGGSISYYYSTDSGASWIFAGEGGSYSVSSTEPSFKVRIELSTTDTLATPAVYSVTVVFTTAIESFHMAVPETVVAGEAFGMAVYAKDSSNTTMVHWTGPVSLTAMDAEGLNEATGDLSVTVAQITSGGYVIVPNQRYYVAETITVMASTPGAEGLSDQIVVTPGPIVGLEMLPEDLTTVTEHTAQEFTAFAYDAYGNTVTDTEFLWTLEGNLGALSSTTGPEVTLYAGDGGNYGWINVSCSGLTAPRMLTVQIEHNPPTYNQTLPDQTVDEDYGSWSIDLSQYVTDVAHPASELRWYATNEHLVTVTGENRTGHMTMLFTTVKDAFGSEVLRVTVVDPEGLSATADMAVNVTPVNDAPRIDPVDPLVVHFDDPYFYNFRYYITDVDDDYDDLTLSVDPASLQYVSVDRLVLEFDYPEELNGTSQQVTVSVTDGELSASTIVTVNVTDDNVPVLVENLPDVSMYQGETLLDVFDLAEHFADPDEEMLYYASGYEHVGVSITAEGSVNMFAPTDWWGEEYVVFSAIDPLGARVEDAVLVTVLPVNQPPWIEGVPDLMVRFDTAYEFDLTRYMGDMDDDLDDLEVTADDSHVTAVGPVMRLLYPSWTLGSIFKVNLTVTDGELYDSCAFNVTVTSDYPPEAFPMPDHSFMEDVPILYPVDSGLEDLFVDMDADDNLTFEALCWADSVEAVASSDASQSWKVSFDPEDNWFGMTYVTVRATDPHGAITESSFALTIASVADAPHLALGMTYNVTAGVQAAFDISGAITDPDSSLTDFAFTVDEEYWAYVDAIAGVLVLDFPESYLEGQSSRTVTIELTVTDQDGLDDTATFTVVVTRPFVSPLDANPWMYVAMLLLGGAALAMLMIAVAMRKQPFVVKDAMLIHNDGFLISRLASPTEGEIDQDVLSGMLTAVLNFVEDSMAGNSNTLRSFGFREYKVLVRRGRASFLALVHEGDAPESIEAAMADFLGKVERVYRKSLAKWSGDIESEFAGAELLLQAFVKEHSRKPRKGAGGILWKAKEKTPPQAL